ncbi:MAG TPA: RidA family protein [Candidatus Acidoferrales bacterium]|nr:RidA family protein [Candidatus Acidoferrales bacterium]
MSGNWARNIVKAVCAVAFIAALAAMPAMQTGAQQNGRKYVPAPAAGGYQGLPFSEAVAVGNTVYIAGHIGTDPKSGQAPADLDAEIKNLFDAFRGDAEKAGVKMDDLVSVTVYCTDLSLYEKFNAAYRKEFTKDFPARAFIGVASLLRGGHFEIEGVAVMRGAKVVPL